MMAREKYRRTHLQLLHDAEQKRLEQGIERGRDVPSKLKAKEMPLGEIAKVIDLSLEEIQGL